jgi:solute carrier family 12 sodium/potassium/chloride transporter 2
LSLAHIAKTPLIERELRKHFAWQVSESDLELHREKTNFHLRIAEIVRENSLQSSLIVMTLPLPKKGSLPPLLYMAWLDFVTQKLPPFLLLRGNQDSVLTFYS